ncbi:nitroreductase family protein [Marinomonas fungiae]|uniref:Putative NAD(P)H nitroreductase n=1 Tax=Marinomonas fungiae TaxID=1137284 RepID=A0A0K6ILF2_9GAMM|nr:nitroreductase [Marinomonas fungiae]CUB03916.1 Nitroreductase [Marinomonas fungiae]
MSKDFLQFMRDRVSNNQLAEPAPTHSEWREILDAASRAADHGNLKPWRFKVYEGDARSQVGEVYWQHAKSEVEQLSDDKADVFIKKAYRAPAILLVYADLIEHPKVPEMEQLMAVAASAQQALLGLNALGYAGIWRTGPAVFTDAAKNQLGLTENQQVVGLIYVGTASAEVTPVENTGIDERLTFVS